MMDQMIIITLVLISFLSIVNGQLNCYVCTNCPNIDDLDETMSQPCDFVTPPNTPTSSPNTEPSTVITTPSTTITTPSTTITTPSTTVTTPSITITTLSTTITQSPTPNTTHSTTHSTPNTPPTASTRPSTSTETSQYSDNGALSLISIVEATTNNSSYLYDENNDKTIKRPRRSKQISPGSPYRNSMKELSETQRCFRIERIVGDTTEVVRGCVVAANTLHQTCVRANNGIAPRSCRICQQDDCNTAMRNISTSIVLIFTSILTTKLLS